VIEEKNTAKLSTAAKAAIDGELKKYPADRKRSACMAALTFVQKENGGHLTDELIEAVANYLDISAIAAFEVASFYSMYELKPVGRHKVCLCTNVPCMLRGAEALGDHMKKRLGINYGETTKDGRITLKEVECMGACVGAPMMQVDDDVYHENLTPETADKILDKLT
jgi:NADH-quinone oxidoreductase subunit E